MYASVCFVFEEKLIWKKSAGWNVICIVQYVCFVPIKTAVISPLSVYNFSLDNDPTHVYDSWNVHWIVLYDFIRC